MPKHRERTGREPTKELRGSVTEIAPGGDGVLIAEIDGERRAVFVPGVASGEIVRVVADLSRRPARGRLLEIVSPSPARVPAPCQHVDRCGGCDWMHLAPAEQTAEHARMAARVLHAVLGDVEVKSHSAPSPLAYRTRARVHAASTKRGVIEVGMYGRRSREPAVVPSCIVLDPALEAARRSLSDWLAGAKGHGEARLSLGSPSTSPRRAVLDLGWTGELPATIFGKLERAVNDPTSAIGGARVYAGDVRVPATIGDPTPWIVGADGSPLRLAPGGFSQATEEGNAILARRVAELSRAIAGEGPCVELYAGAGNLTILLARDFTVAAVESSGEACEAARVNLAARSLDARVVAGDAGAFTIPRDTRLLVLDPPRTGARDVASTIASLTPRSRPQAILYVSCDLPTLARDLTILAGAGYAARAVETFEMFPQTSHVETVVALVRA